MMETLSKDHKNLVVADESNIGIVREPTISSRGIQYPIKLDKRSRCARCRKNFDQDNSKHRTETAYAWACDDILFVSYRVFSYGTM
jgi:hypothetical protein